MIVSPRDRRYSESNRLEVNMRPLLLMVTVLIPLSGFSADWNARLAADYLDSRQKEWFAWPQAKVEGGICVSCHTGVTYLLARPVLRKALGETEPTAYEKGLLEGIHAQAEAEGNRQGAEAVFASLFFALQNGNGKTLSGEEKRAFDQLWSLQIHEGKDRGAWKWPNANHDPWSTPDAPFYGAALAALAVGTAPAEYRELPEIRERIKALTDYLQREEARQPLHNRLALLWASSKLPAVASPSLRQGILDEILRAQQADGGWAIASLGPWQPHPDAPPSSGSSSYATGYVAFVLQQAGVPRSDKAVAKALDWLRAHQDPQSGSWAATSLNSRHDPASMQFRFMQDAATAFASLALLGK
jgi:squalene-hopene/tetraprenyl-beta-curcumene cyclase